MAPHTIGFIILPIALAGLAWQVNKTRLARATANWNKVPCTVSSVETVAQDSALSDEETFAVSAHYSYEVGGKILSSTKVTNSHSEFLTRAEAAKLVSGIPQSGPHHAYYNPKNPQDAVLVPGSDMTNVKEAAILAFLVVFSIFMIVKG